MVILHQNKHIPTGATGFVHCSPFYLHTNYFQNMITKTDFTKILFSLFFCSFLLTDSFGQLNNKRGHLEIRAGITTGSPIVFKNIPSDATGRPGVGLNAGFEYTYIFHPKFSMTLGVAYAKKGSSFTSPVSGKYDATRGVFGERFPFPLRVKYTGNVAAGFDMTI